MKYSGLYYALAGVIMLLMAGCQSPKEPTAEEVVMLLQRSDRLYVAEYLIHKIVTASDIKRLNGKVLNQNISLPLSIGDKKIAIPMDAVVKAYIDFNSVTTDDIVIGEDGSLKIILPAPRVALTSSKIDHHGVREYTDFFRTSFTDSQISDFENQGRKAIMASLPKMGIEKTAQQNAREVLTPILMQAGFQSDKITIEYR